MGNIPLVIAGKSALATIPETTATGEQFGAGIGRALGGLGDTISQAGTALAAAEREKAAKEKAKAQDAQYADAVAQSDFTPQILEARKNAPPDGSGVYDATSNAYDKFITDQANKITDPEVRAKYTNTMKLRKPEILSGQATFENVQATAYGKDQADLSLNTLDNKIRSDPTEAAYGTAVTDGAAVIQARNLSQGQKDAMIAAWNQSAAYSHFQGMLASAKSLAEFDAIEKQMTAKDSPWQSRMDPKQFDSTLDQVASARNAFGTIADANARAMITDFQKRTNDLVQISPGELAAGQDLIKQAKNSLLQVQYARVARDQELIARGKDVPPAELRRLIEANKNGPLGGLPPQASAAVNDAAGHFNVSSGYLTGTVTREYGGEFTKPSKGTVDYLQARGPDQNVAGLDANFADRLARAISIGEAATGEKAVLRDAYRTPELQAQFYADYKQVPITYKGVTYQPRPHTPEHPGGLAAAPGLSYHQSGQAADIQSGKLLDWLHLHATDYGLEFLKGHAFEVDSEHIQLAKTAGGGINYGKGTQGSAAVGAFQFLPETWLGIMHDGKTPQRFGLDITGKSDAQLLELRKDVNVSANMAAAYAEQNTPILAAVLGRTPTDSELYMAHFLGPSGAASILKVWKENPNAIAANLAPEAAKANHNVFYDKKGSPFTVDQVYHNIAASFSAAPDQVAYGDNQTYDKMATAADTAINKDFVSFNRSTGKFNMGNLDDPNGYVIRSQGYRAAADFYSVPVSEGKPFSTDEAASINTAYKNAKTTDEQLAILSNIQAMGTDVARAAYKQLGETNPTMEYAADLKFNRGQDAAAHDVMEGQKRIDTKDTQIMGAIEGQNAVNIRNMINSELGAALFAADPKWAAQVGKAATAHYVNTQVASNGIDWNGDGFKKSLNAVLGGTKDAPAYGEVNGAQTLMPKDNTGAALNPGVFNRAIDRMTPDDWVRLSLDKKPPRYVDGAVIPPRDLADEAHFKAIGNNAYQVQFADGGFAVTGEIVNGKPAAYIFIADPTEIKNIAAGTPSGFGPSNTPSGRGFGPSVAPGAPGFGPSVAPGGGFNTLTPDQIVERAGKLMETEVEKQHPEWTPAQKNAAVEDYKQSIRKNVGQ